MIPDPARILLADDEDTFRDSTADLLRREGYYVTTAVDSAQALAYLETEPFDVLIADIPMPGNGELGLARDAPRLYPNLPVILVTGYPSLYTALPALEMKVDSYLVKPLDLAELLFHVERAIKRRRLLNTAQITRQRNETWRQDLEVILAGVSAAERQISPVTADAFVTVAMEQIATGLQDIQALVNVLALNQPGTHVCGQLNCPRSRVLTGALIDTVQTLEATKNSFKSRELGALRERLERVLQGQTDLRAAP